MNSDVTHSTDRDESILSDKTFAKIAALAHREAGLTISEKKKALVQSRISRRLRSLNMSDFDQYYAYVEEGNDHTEIANMISVLTTNVSSFFREEHHFEYLQKNVFPELLEKARSGGRVRIWSAGCSSGQEPYSIAMLLSELESSIGTYDVKILATDIDNAILDVARAAEYNEHQLNGLIPERRKRFLTTDSLSEDTFKVHNNITKLVTFRHLNLLKEWPMQGPFDIVFCRNVVIYFDEATQSKLWPRFRRIIRDKGTFFLGHSERIPTPASCGFDTAGVTTYSAT